MKKCVHCGDAARERECKKCPTTSIPAPPECKDCHEETSHGTIDIPRFMGGNTPLPNSASYAG
ncbi:MAG: hypothetical protein COU46_03520 [Candidatus Niyogibacteria bacterium CG10_big_fil_rev_8_21_14_0_10_42_19]|uniref:Uncharacterized protein n=1 Tax=Candidatus Niyogibacteria bacterium CG10_big_fil_rev_8_21_14_0_10_42_19 TaxID=1974725 RepID=A0A2H0TGG7_9BACT|nr:MAG: hypothetical protein COU46_03520 [Candidatus Niyogibacteria bacterium CG10_big_fil_rev_8_21_14_0_10_42_19]